MYRERIEKESRLNLKLKMEKNNLQINLQNLTQQEIEELLKDKGEDDKPAKVISMKEYLNNFCTEHGIVISPGALIKLPMHIFLNSAQSGAFLEYKKGKIFEILDKTKE